MENYRSRENISVLQSIIRDYNNLLDEFACVQIKRGVKLKTFQSVCNDFLNRTRINSEALLPLLETYKTQRSGILPIGLLIRSVLSDFLTFCYLATFTDSQDKEETSIQNELDLLEKDFLQSVVEVIQIEGQIGRYNPNITSAFEDVASHEKHINELKERYKHLFKSENTQLRFKRPNEFRETSLKMYFDSKEDFGSARSFMTEKYKWQRMEKRGFSKYVTVFIGFKFFSQLQHYSRESMILMNGTSEPFAFFHILMAVNSITIVTDMQIQIIDGVDSKYLPRVRALEERLDSITQNRSKKGKSQ